VRKQSALREKFRMISFGRIREVKIITQWMWKIRTTANHGKIKRGTFGKIRRLFKNIITKSKMHLPTKNLIISVKATSNNRAVAVCCHHQNN
jgi:hypothetical protein